MSSQKFVQLPSPSLPPDMLPSSASAASRYVPGAAQSIPPPRSSVEEGAGPRVFDQAASPSTPRSPSLNERDLELLRHLAHGRSTGQIATAMSVTGNTTRTRIRRVQRKLAVARREQVVAAARQFGVV